MVNGKAEDSLFFTMTRALWAITRGDDVAAAQGMLSELAALSPQQEAEAEGFGLFLAASYDRMPANLGEILDSYGNAHPQSGVLTVVRAILEVYRFDGLAALKALESTDDFGLASGIEPFVRGLALLVAGRLDEALVFSLNRRIEARRGLDRFGFVANSYVAALALTQSGFGQHADLMMSSVFALGRPGFLASALHDAMLRLVGLRALMDEEKEPASVGAQARTHVADIGPLPGPARAFLTSLPSGTTIRSRLTRVPLPSSTPNWIAASSRKPPTLRFSSCACFRAVRSLRGRNTSFGTRRSHPTTSFWP
ncbi:hypothetical protein AHiyo8_43380 [Arthrobacter sp. Hiyo8]|nr:hypothetical protein AHiyo8_43380 [Arthrobacter sp. Hiyo8]